MKPESNPNYVAIKPVILNAEYMPDGCPKAGHIQCIEVGEKGFKFLRLHPSYNGETFFLNQEQFDKSNWVSPNKYYLGLK